MLMERMWQGDIPNVFSDLSISPSLTEQHLIDDLAFVMEAKHNKF